MGLLACIDDKVQVELDEEIKLFKKMNDIITHRGPDDEGYYQDEFIQFGFRRLSIIDIDSGHQPLTYENERYWIIFNGEIYNYLEIREELQQNGLTFATNTDTEIIVALYSLIKEKAVNKLRGMFAFVIWDKQEQELIWCARPLWNQALLLLRGGITEPILLRRKKASCLQWKKPH